MPSREAPCRRFAYTEWMRLLRQAVNRHRLDRGVLRLFWKEPAQRR